MKIFRMSVTVFMLSCFFLSSVSGDITFANKKSGFNAVEGNLYLGGATLAGGTIRTTVESGLLTSDPDNSEDDGTEIACSGTMLEYVADTGLSSSVVLDGGVKTTGATGVGISLGSDSESQELRLSGGIPLSVTVVAGTSLHPAILSGYGQLTGLKLNAGTHLVMRWQGPLTRNFEAIGDAPVVTLERDLLLGTTVGFTAEGSYVTNLDFNGYRLVMGGTEPDAVSINGSQLWTNANVFLVGGVRLLGGIHITFNTDGQIVGNNNRMNLLASSYVDRGDNIVTFTDVNLNELSTGVLRGTAGDGYWNFINTTMTNADQSFTVTGQIINANAGVFAGTTKWNNASLVLNESLVSTATWQFAGESSIDGSGLGIDCTAHVFKLFDDLTLRNVTLYNVGSAAFDNLDGSSGHTLRLSDVTWTGADNSVHVTSTTNDDALLVLDHASSAGDIFNTNSQWTNACIELKSDVAITSWWTFNGECIIEGGGKHLAMSDAYFYVVAGSTLRLRNVVLDDVNSNSLVNSGGSLYLADVTIRLGNADVDWHDFSQTIIIDGPLYVVTGSHTLTMPSYPGTTTLDGVTAYYDTLSGIDGANLVGCTGSGRVLFVDAPRVGNVTIVSGTVHLSNNEYLSSSGGGAGGRSLIFESGGNTLYNGSGRSVSFPASSDPVFIVRNTTNVVTENILLDGLLPEHLSVQGGSSLTFGDGTVIRLHADWALDKELKFGANPDDASEVMTLDLCGYTIDMSDVNAKISLHYTDNSEGALKTLRICNGRITNVSGSKLYINDNSKLILEDIQLVLNAGSIYTIANDALVTIEGNCVFSGITTGCTFNFSSFADFTIASGSTLTLADGVELFHNNAGTDNFVFADATATLQLIGGAFSRLYDDEMEVPNQLNLLTGRLIVDHASTLFVGNGIAFGNGSSAQDLQIIIRPSASLNVLGNGSLLYKNTN